MAVFTVIINQYYKPNIEILPTVFIGQSRTDGIAPENQAALLMINRVGDILVRVKRQSDPWGSPTPSSCEYCLNDPGPHNYIKVASLRQESPALAALWDISQQASESREPEWQNFTLPHQPAPIPVFIKIFYGGLAFGFAVFMVADAVGTPGIPGEVLWGGLAGKFANMALTPQHKKNMD